MKKVRSELDKKRFQSEFYTFLKGVALSMRIGNSFRAAVKDSLHLLSDKNKKVIDSIMELVVFTQHNKLDLKCKFRLNIYREFIKIDLSSHQSLHRIDLWLENLEKESDFRHKSGQIMHQLYIQAFILCSMYFALLAFVLSNYDFEDNIKIISVSFGLFLVGLCICFKLGRKIKWNF